MNDQSLTEFNKWFESTDLPNILNKAKTIDRKECFEIYKYFIQYRPSVIFEFGVQFGCSTRFFLELAKHLNLNVNMHCFDIKNIIKFVEPNQITMHIEDITNKVEEVFNSLPKPDLIFLDAHPYQLTKILVQKCLEEKINFMAHDTSQEIGKIETAKRTNNFTNFSNSIVAAWELYILCELISQDLWTNPEYHNDKLDLNITTGRYGLAICQHK